MDVQFGPFLLKRVARQLTGPDGPVELSNRSFDILALLLAQPNQVLSKAEIFDAVWPGLVVEENTLQVHISALRKALGPEMIATVHGRGYKYAGPEPRPAAGAVATPVLSTGHARSPGSKPTVEVKAFANMSGDPGQDYFSIGLTEDIIVELSKNRLLNVLGRQSSPNADYVLEGSVRRMGDQVRITAQLSASATAGNVFAERYDRPIADIFAVQDDLVRRLASTIVGHVERHDASTARSKVTGNLDAYDCWLRANYGVELWTLDGNNEAMRLLAEAISKDPGFARAHASISFAYVRQATMSPGSMEIPALEAKALESASLAVRLDVSDARAHNALGWVLMYSREFDRAAAEFRLSAELNPNDGSNCIDRAMALAFLGDQQAADEAAERAAALNPIPTEFYSESRAIVHFVAKRHDAADKFFALTSNTQPDTMVWRAANCICLSKNDEAVELMNNAIRIVEQRWRGPAPMRHQDFLDWFNHINMLRRDEDRNYLNSAILKTGILQIRV